MGDGGRDRENVKNLIYAVCCPTDITSPMAYYMYIISNKMWLEWYLHQRTGKFVYERPLFNYVKVSYNDIQVQAILIFTFRNYTPKWVTARRVLSPVRTSYRSFLMPMVV